MTSFSQRNASHHTYPMSHVTHVHESCRTFPCITSHIPTSHATHIHESCHTHPQVQYLKLLKNLKVCLTSQISTGHVTRVHILVHTYIDSFTSAHGPPRHHSSQDCCTNLNYLSPNYPYLLTKHLLPTKCHRTASPQITSHLQGGEDP